MVIKTLVSFAFGIYMVGANASQYTPVNTSEAPIVVDVEGSEVMTLNKPNSAGISVNNYSVFHSDSLSELKILNLKSINKSDQVSKVIVIQANDVQLNGVVELVGETADLLILVPSSSSSTAIACNNCRFKNFGRVSLAVAAPQSNITQDSQALPGLTTFSGGISLSNVDASKVSAFEVLAADVSLNSSINTNLKVRNHPNGGYEEDESGNLTAANGGVNIMIGRGITWDYQGSRIASVVNTQQVESQLNGRVRSAHVKILTNKPLVLNTTFDTSFDIVSTSYYRGHLNIPDPEVRVVQLSSNSLEIVNTIESDQIHIRSGGDVTISSTLKGKFLTVLVDNKVTVSGRLLADTVEVSSRYFYNSGELFAEKIFVHSERDVKNSYGGRIHGGVISLVSDIAEVINGSKLPFIYNGDTWGEAEPDYPSATDNMDSGYYSVVDETLGQKVDNLSAHITGREVHIKGLSVRNINPYYVYKSGGEDWTGGIPLDLLRARQVSITGSELLNVHTGAEFENSSAITGVTSSSGKLNITSPIILNERYRTQIGMHTSFEVLELADTGSGFGRVERSGGADNISTDFFIYSPPGKIYSIGDYESNGIALLNKHSFFEVYGKAIIASSSIMSTDLSLSEARYRWYVDTYIVFLGQHASRQHFTGTTILESHESATLFYVHGAVERGGELTIVADHAIQDLSVLAENYVVDSFEEKNQARMRENTIAHDPLYIADPGFSVLQSPDYNPHELVVRPRHYFASPHIDTPVNGGFVNFDLVTQIPFDSDTAYIHHDHSSKWLKHGKLVKYKNHASDKAKVDYGRIRTDIPENLETITVYYEDCTATAKTTRRVKESPKLYYAWMLSHVYSKPPRVEKTLEVVFDPTVSIPASLTRLGIAFAPDYVIQSGADIIRYFGDFVMFNNQELYDFRGRLVPDQPEDIRLQCVTAQPLGGTPQCVEVDVEYDEAAEDAWALDHAYHPDFSFTIDSYSKRKAVYKSYSNGGFYPVPDWWEREPDSVFDYEDATVKCKVVVEEEFDMWVSIKGYINYSQAELNSTIDNLINWWE